MANRQLKPFSTNNFKVKIMVGTTALEAFFSKSSAMKKTYASSPYSDGTTNIIRQLPGAITYEDITLSKPMTEDDDVLMTAINAANTLPDQFVSINVQPVYRDGYYSKEIGGSFTAEYCTVKSVSLPEIDTGGEGVAMIEIVLSPGYIDSTGSKKFWKEPTSV